MPCRHDKTSSYIDIIKNLRELVSDLHRGGCHRKNFDATATRSVTFAFSVSPRALVVAAKDGNVLVTVNAVPVKSHASDVVHRPLINLTPFVFLQEKVSRTSLIKSVCCWNEVGKVK
jgi:hypothetical protein